VLTACAPSKQITIVNSWLNREKMKERPVKKIYIIGLFQNTDVSLALEYALRDEAKSRRYVAYMNQDQFPYKIDNHEEQKRMILEKVKKLGCDAIFVTALKDVQSETHYVSTSSVGVGVSGYYPVNSYQGDFNSYYTSYYAETSLSGYYETNKMFFIESNLYDTNTLELLWSVQSQSYNPSGIETVTKDYCDELFRLLEKEKDFRGKKTKE
jgi:hypothetical protein